MINGYSDRVAHALAFAAKHGQLAPGRGSGTAWPTRPANVAVILARHGADETTIVAGVLAPMVNESLPSGRDDLLARVREKFGEHVAGIVRQVAEPRLDARGKERRWEVWRLDFLACLGSAEPAALDVTAAAEIHACGSALTDVRRLGAEYLAGHGDTGPASVVAWFADLVDTLERHPQGPNRALLAELRGLSRQLESAVRGRLP